jgi:hypothetical protein
VPLVKRAAPFEFLYLTGAQICDLAQFYLSF